MIYLSCIPLKTRSREVQRLLGNPYEMHRRLMRPFLTPHNDRVLFRAEEFDGGARVLVQHLQPVDWRRAFEDRELAGEPVQKRLDLEEAIEKEKRLRFRLLANPTRRISTREEKPGPRVDIRGDEEQAQWMERKAEQGGFRLENLRVLDRGLVTSLKPAGDKRKRLTHRCVEFEGVLTVKDPGCFLESLQCGIGAAKGLGFGLLTIARP